MLTTLIAACTPTLGTFDRFTPKDRGGALVLRDAAFGDDARQQLDVYAPMNVQSAPVIFFIYGGSWDSGDKADYRFAALAFAARGFVTVVADYRIGPQHRFPRFIEDGASALRWTRENIVHYGGDPDRIVIVGHSAGAYNAMMLALDRRYLDEAGVEFRAIRGVAGVAGPYNFLPFDVRESQEAFGKWPHPEATQPITYARGDAPPLLLIHGARDTKVYTRNMTSLAAKIEAAGGQVETKLYPQAAHVDIMLALSRPLRGRAPTLADVTEFATRVTKPEPALAK
jgi:acetyl esterase/lipase